MAARLTMAHRRASCRTPGHAHATCATTCTGKPMPAGDARASARIGMPPRTPICNPYAAGPVQSRESGSLSRITMQPGRISAAYRAGSRVPVQHPVQVGDANRGDGHQKAPKLKAFAGGSAKSGYSQRPTVRACPPLGPRCAGGRPLVLSCRARFPFEGPYATVLKVTCTCCCTGRRNMYR